MKVMAFNGSPRREWNTATLLEKALEGAASMGAETELVYLYDLDFKGCRSCFECKLKGGKSYGKCAVRDDLRPILNKVEHADVIHHSGLPYLSGHCHRRDEVIHGATDLSIFDLYRSSRNAFS